MLKVKCALLTCLYLITFNASANTENPWYLEWDNLWFSGAGDFKTEQTTGFTLGYQWQPRHSAEFEIQINGLDSSAPGFEVDADLISYLAGYRYDFQRTEHYRLFVGGGVGISQPEFFVAEDQQVDDTVYMAFARVGIETRLWQSLILSGEIRYQYIDDLEHDTISYEIGGTTVIGLTIGYRF